MLKKLLTTTALVLVLSAPAWAEDPAQAPDSSAITPPPAETEAGATMETDAEGAGTAESEAATTPAEEEPLEGVAAEEPAADTAEEPAMEAAEQPTTDEGVAPDEGATDAAAARAVPEAVIANQADSELRANELMGMSVVSADGQEVGEVSDLIFDEQEKLSGIVVGMGGFLGIGQKFVGIDWTKAEIQTDAESDKERIFVGLTAMDLETAPDFMTKQDIQNAAEAEAAAAAAAAAAQSDMGAAPPPSDAQ